MAHLAGHTVAVPGGAGSWIGKPTCSKDNRFTKVLLPLFPLHSSDPSPFHEKGLCPILDNGDAGTA